MKTEELMQWEEGELSGIDEAAATQKLINELSWWSSSGHFGRTMMASIKSGRCLLGKTAYAGVYGFDKVPGRNDVEQGTKGSYDFVVKHSGKDWADFMEAL